MALRRLPMAPREMAATWERHGSTLILPLPPFSVAAESPLSRRPPSPPSPLLLSKGAGTMPTAMSSSVVIVPVLSKTQTSSLPKANRRGGDRVVTWRCGLVELTSF